MASEIEVYLIGGNCCRKKKFEVASCIKSES